MAIEVQSADLIRVLIQFLRENNLNETAKTLQTESNVNLNYIEDRRDFALKVTSGRWDEVLEEVSQLNLPEHVLIDIHEQVFNEMLEINELEAARAILRQGSPLKQLKENNIERYLKLENLLSQTVLNGEIPSQIKESKNIKRESILNIIFEHVEDVPRSRLMSLLSSALKWEESNGIISENSSFNLLLGQVPSSEPFSNRPLNLEINKFPKNLYKSVKLPTGSCAECVGFSPNGAFFVVGMSDGFLEVWNYLEGTIRTDLPYQTCETDLISMKSAISCISFSHDSELLAVGTIEGEVGIWRLSSGKLVKLFQNVHQNGITSISFSQDQQSLLTTGFDNNIHILGMKSGRILKELRGHSSYVNCAVWLDEGHVLSGSHDGSVKFWDLNKIDCVSTTFPKEEKALSPPPIKSICKLITIDNDILFLVTCQSTKLHLYSITRRDFVQVIPTKLKDENYFMSCQVRNGQIFALSSNGILLGIKGDDFSTLIGSEKVCEVEPIGFALHPKFNISITFDVSGEIKFWK